MTGVSKVAGEHISRPLQLAIGRPYLGFAEARAFKALATCTPLVG